jgi:hypothetical protein
MLSLPKLHIHTLSTVPLYLQYTGSLSSFLHQDPPPKWMRSKCLSLSHSFSNTFTAAMISISGYAWSYRRHSYDCYLVAGSLQSQRMHVQHSSFLWTCRNLCKLREIVSTPSLAHCASRISPGSGRELKLRGEWWGFHGKLHVILSEKVKVLFCVKEG